VLHQVAIDHMEVIANDKELIRSFFQDPHVVYAA